ncbi:hypothetical protein BUALT_Bualt10G0140800 [Buddleja alternifolia]|uniref:Pentatricopeptide repeat-containing protein n=1 Tax=Buddleja alternifolia TaxID=168488 RepID=A0AAV6X794_9LAMI|nr:hypothetical protein BUALT_Bualt10G0140800 [Buddleja alternifolia]
MSSLLRAKFVYNRYLSTLHMLQNSCLRSSFSSDSGGGGHCPPEPIPNRPLRTPSRNPKFTKSNPRPWEKDNRNLSRGENDHDFLERFKLGFDAKMENVDKPPPPESGVDNNSNSDKAENNNNNNEPLSPPLDADEIFTKMKETGLIPNAVAMLDGLCKDGLVQEAMKLFGLMREKGMIPEVVIYTAVVEGFCKAHKFDDAVRIFKKMQSNRVVPNAFSYGVLIRGLCKGKRFEDAYGFSIEMLEAGHSPNLATFTGLIDGYCREKDGQLGSMLYIGVAGKHRFRNFQSSRSTLNRSNPKSHSSLSALLRFTHLEKASLNRESVVKQFHHY